jgi:hypothetical protein
MRRTKPRCERWAHEGTGLGERCQTQIGEPKRRFPCLAKVVPWCERCGLAVAECICRRAR